MKANLFDRILPAIVALFCAAMFAWGVVLLTNVFKPLLEVLK
jgi:hypothetical protein